MTDKEKYEQALERARQAILECDDNEGRKSIICGIFPELKESEDERTRETLMEYVQRWKVGEWSMSMTSKIRIDSDGSKTCGCPSCGREVDIDMFGEKCNNAEYYTQCPSCHETFYGQLEEQSSLSVSTMLEDQLRDWDKKYAELMTYPKEKLVAMLMCKREEVGRLID